MMKNRWFRAAGQFIFNGLVYTGVGHGFTVERSVLIELGLITDEDSIDREWAALVAREQLRP